MYSQFMMHGQKNIKLHETCLWQDWNVYCTEVTVNTPTRPQ